MKVRLAEIDTSERRQPRGQKAKDALAQKVFGEVVRVDVVTTERYGRSFGKIHLGERDINRELIAEGHAWVYRRYLEDETLLADEQAACDQRSGLWGLPDPVPPWEWRRR